jgi:hypothetical protein
MLCETISGIASMMRWMFSRSPLKSGMSVSIVVPGLMGDHAVLHAHQLHRFGHAHGLFPVDLRGTAGSDGAETAGAGADIAEDHERSGAGSPAFAHVRAVAAFADRVQLVFIDEPADVKVIFTGGQFHAQPVGFLHPFFLHFSIHCNRLHKTIRTTFCRKKN